jgi:hypothetical protein
MALAAYDRIIGLQLADIAVDGCITKAPCDSPVSGPTLRAASIQVGAHWPKDVTAHLDAGYDSRVTRTCSTAWVYAAESLAMRVVEECTPNRGIRRQDRWRTVAGRSSRTTTKFRKVVTCHHQCTE